VILPFILTELHLLETAVQGNYIKPAEKAGGL